MNDIVKLTFVYVFLIMVTAGTMLAILGLAVLWIKLVTRIFGRTAIDLWDSTIRWIEQR